MNPPREGGTGSHYINDNNKDHNRVRADEDAYRTQGARPPPLPLGAGGGGGGGGGGGEDGQRNATETRRHVSLTSGGHKIISPQVQLAEETIRTDLLILRLPPRSGKWSPTILGYALARMCSISPAASRTARLTRFLFF